jgi:hypothetical protein
MKFKVNKKDLWKFIARKKDHLIIKSHVWIGAWTNNIVNMVKKKFNIHLNLTKYKELISTTSRKDY